MPKSISHCKSTEIFIMAYEFRKIFGEEFGVNLVAQNLGVSGITIIFAAWIIHR